MQFTTDHIEWILQKLDTAPSKDRADRRNKLFIMGQLELTLDQSVEDDRKEPEQPPEK